MGKKLNKVLAVAMAVAFAMIGANVMTAEASTSTATFVLHVVKPTATPEASATVQPAPTATTTGSQSVLSYQKNADGTLILDANGNPLPIVPEGQEIPVSYERNEDGTLILDADGNPIVTATVPAGSQESASILDELDPNRRIDIYVAWQGGTPAIGADVIMTAILTGYGDASYTLQWQTSKDNASWQDVAGATDPRLMVTMTQDNYLDYWRVTVNVDDGQ